MVSLQLARKTLFIKNKVELDTKVAFHISSQAPKSRIIKLHWIPKLHCRKSYEPPKSRKIFKKIYPKIKLIYLFVQFKLRVTFELSVLNSSGCITQ